MSNNDITGDRIVTDIPSEKFKSGWDAIFGKPQSSDEVWAKKGKPTHYKAEYSTGYCHESSCPKIAWYDDAGCPLMGLEERLDRENNGN